MFVKILAYIPLSLNSPANICLRNIYSIVSPCELLFFSVKFQTLVSPLIQDDIYHSFCLRIFGLLCLCKFPTHMKLYLIFSCWSVSCQFNSETNYKNLTEQGKKFFFLSNKRTVIHQIETTPYLGVTLHSALSHHQHTNSHRVLSISLAFKTTTTNPSNPSSLFHSY